MTVQSSTTVEFFDPRFAEQQASKGGGAQDASAPVTQPLIDDEELPSLDSEEYILDVPPVKLSFSQPVMTTRKAYSGRRRTGAEKSEETESETGNDQTDVSTDEPTIRGQLPAAEFDAIDDQSDDTHLYARKFEAFSAMVELLRTKGCRQVSGGIRKLPALAGYSKHLLEDGNPRCIAFHLLTKHGQSYALLEVDTSDNKNRLSTLLLKQPTPYFDWQGEITILEKNLLRKPLNWPTSHLKLVFPDHHKRISYPRTLSGNKGLVEPGSMQCWADRMYLALE